MTARLAACLALFCVGCEERSTGRSTDASMPHDASSSPDAEELSSPDTGTLDASVMIPSKADILFVVDNSGSMMVHQTKLVTAISRFVDRLAGSVDYRIGVVSTDVTDSELRLCGAGETGNCDPGERSGLTTTTFSPTPPNPFVSTDTSGCVLLQKAHGCLLGTTTIVSSEMPRADQISALGANLAPGTCGSGQEQGLHAALLALGERSDGCNQGFLRSDARLVLVIVSDENDDDPNSTAIATLVSRFEAIKSPALLRVAVIGGFDDSGAAARCRTGSSGSAEICGSTCDTPPASGSHITGCNAGTSCPSGEYCDPTQNRCENSALQFWQFCHWCSYYATDTCCSALAATRYWEFATALENKITAAVPELSASGCRGSGPSACVVSSVCQSDFGPALETIADRLVR